MWPRECSMPASQRKLFLRMRQLCPDCDLRKGWTLDFFSWERPSDCPLRSLYQCPYFLWRSRDDFLEASEFTVLVTSDSGACCIFMTIFNIGMWTGVDTEEGPDHSFKLEIAKIIDYSVSKTLRLFSLLIRELSFWKVSATWAMMEGSTMPVL